MVTCNTSAIKEFPKEVKKFKQVFKKQHIAKVAEFVKQTVEMDVFHLMADYQLATVSTVVNVTT